VAELSDSSAALAPAAPRADAGPAAIAPRARPRTLPAVAFGRLALAAGELSLASASVFLCGWLFALPSAQREAFLSANALGPPSRNHVFLGVFALAIVPLAISGAVWLRYKAQAAPWIVRAGEVCAPLSLACAVPNLLDYQHWYAQPLPYLLLLLGFVLALERLLTRAFARSPLALRPQTIGAPSGPARYAPFVIVVLGACGYTAYMTHFTIMRHQLMGTAGFDLGIFDNLMMNALHGRPFRSTVAVPMGSYLSNHAEYGMFLFVPIYALHPAPETLLFLQSLFMGFAALPLYFFAATQISRPAAAALSCAYLLFAPLHGPNFYDFHWMPVSMFFFYWLFYALARRKVWSVAILTVVICSMREDAALGLIATGLFVIVSGYWVRLGVVLSAVCAAWFVLVKFVIMPWAGPWWFADIYKDLLAAGEKGYGSIVKTILINPNYFLKTLLTESKFIYALHMFAPLCLLPLRHPALALLMLPGFFVTMMTTGYAPTLSISFQYTTTFIPFLFGAAAIALRLRGRSQGLGARRASVIALCAGVFCHSFVFGAILQRNTFTGGFSRVFFEMSDAERERYKALREVAALIPPKASVAATELEIPHVSNRLDAYTLKISAGDAQYLFIDSHHLDLEAKQQAKGLLKAHPFGLVKHKGEFFLFKQDLKAPDTESALRTLGLSTHSK
jgi:uncharacterized membrane protein